MVVRKSRCDWNKFFNKSICIVFLGISVFAFLVLVQGAQLSQEAAQGSVEKVSLTFQLNLKNSYWQPLGLPVKGIGQKRTFDCTTKPCDVTLNDLNIGPSNDCPISIEINIPDPSNPQTAHIVSCKPSSGAVCKEFTMQACSDIKFGGAK